MNMPTRRRRWSLALAGLALLTVGFAAGLQNRAAYRYLTVLQEVWSLTRANYIESVDEQTLLDGAHRGMLSALDGASAYLSPGEERLLASPPARGRPGLEALPSGGGPVIVRIDPGGPAERAGLALGDQIWKIDGKPTRLQAWPQIKRRLAGPVGGKLDLVVLDRRTFKLREVRVELEAPQGPGFLAQRREGPVLYARLLDPELVDVSALSRSLHSLLAADREAPLLLDVRGAVSLTPATITGLAGVFLPGAPALRLTPRGGADELLTATDLGPAVAPRRLYVLVDPTCAGAAEALAALLRERSGAVVCGRTTYGLGGLPEVIPLSRGGSVLLTTRELRTPGGDSWSDKGLEPDKLLTPSVGAAADDGRDGLLDEALRWIRAGAVLDHPVARPAA